MSKKIAINGFGRIGRSVARALFENNHRQDLKLVAINELADPEGIAHLLKYDSTHGRFAFSVTKENDTLNVAGDDITLMHHQQIEDINWQSLDVDVVLDCTGVFANKADGLTHLKQGAKKVLYSHPGAHDLDATIIFGINESVLTADHQVVSNGSCTTNCIVPVIKVIDEAFGVESGTITTIHSSMHDQQVIRRLPP